MFYTSIDIKFNWYFKCKYLIINSKLKIIKFPFRIIHHELGIKCRFYDLRGSFATISLRNGCEIKDIAEVLGHKRIETTEKYYISSTNNDKRDVSEKLEQAISSNTISKMIKFKE